MTHHEAVTRPRGQLPPAPRLRARLGVVFAAWIRCAEAPAPPYTRSVSASKPRLERKVVTVVFCDLVGFTARAESLDPEDVEAILRPYHERLRRELERHGGTVEKFIGDAVMAVFGAPVAHEDDPERAVRAALAIRAWVVEEAGIDVRIGVHTGEALVRLDARPEVGEGLVAGDVVDTASRLQGAAPTNAIVVGGGTFRATRDVIEYRDAEAVEVQGKSEPVPVWQAIDARARVSFETLPSRAQLVGRRRELDLLVDAFSRARAERVPQLVTLVGVPGIGKSRLVYELAQVLESDQELIFWRQGRSPPYGEGVTYAALAEIVKAQAGILDSDPAHEVRAKLDAAAQEIGVGEPERGRLVVQLGRLVGVGLDTDRSDDRQGTDFVAWRRFLEALAERGPLVLVFEDLHWAEENLLDFVDHLVDWASGVPLLVVGTARPELLERRPGWGGGKPNALTVSLSPLSVEETASLIEALLERPALPAELQSGLLDRAGGNPLYAEQFVRMLGERPGGDGLPLPETVQGIIAARLDSLPADEKELLQDAAVVGKVFWAGPSEIATAPGSRSDSTASSGSSSSSVSAARPSPARMSSPSGTCSCARSRTGRSRGPTGPRSIAGSRNGSTRSAGGRTTRRCWRITTRQPSTWRALPATPIPCSRRRRARHCARPATERLAYTHTWRRPSSTAEHSSSGL